MINRIVREFIDGLGGHALLLGMIVAISIRDSDISSVITILVLSVIYVLALTFLREELHTVYFAKLRPNAIFPTKRDEDACYDLYACLDEVTQIKPHETVNIPTGIASAFNQKWKVVLYERGSNSKWDGMLQAGIIDSGYRGEYFVSIHNGSDYPILLEPNGNRIMFDGTAFHVPVKKKAICQFAIEEVPQINLKEVNISEVEKVPSHRGSGALGSSGK